MCGGLLARHGAPDAFARYILRRLPGSGRWRAIVGHCDAAGDGARLLAALKRHSAIGEAHLVETGPAVGAHAGRGALVVSLQPEPGGDAGPPAAAP